MKKIYLIGGELATGKTTLAKALSKKLNVMFFYKDVIKEILADNIGYKNREENKKLSVTVFEIFKHISLKAIEVGSDLILESNFKQNEIDELEKIYSNAGYEIYSIVLSGSDEILYKRYLNRFENKHRHPAHSNFSSKEEFDEYNKDLKAVKYIGKILEFNADNFVDVNEVIASL